MRNQDTTTEYAEIATLGGCLLNPRDVFDDVASVVRPDDFSSVQRQEIFRAMLELRAENRAIDPITLMEALEHIDGVASMLSEYLSATPTSANSKHYAEIVASKSRLRLISVQLLAISRDAMAQEADDTAIIAKAQRILEQIHARVPYENVSDVQDVVPLLAETIVNECRTQTGETGLDIGIPSLDMQLDGMRGGDLVVVAARPSVGKSAFMLQIAVNACNQRRPCLFFSLEMFKEHLLERIFAMMGDLPLRGIRKRDLMGVQQDRLLRTANTMAGLPLTIDESAGQRLSEIRAKARRWARRNPNGIVIVDYLGIITPDERLERRDLEVAAMTKALKGLARELKIPVVVASQLGRSAEHESDEYKKLSQLRESGSIEQDSDIVIILSRLSRQQEKLAKEQTKIDVDDLVSVTVAKNRNGATCRMFIKYDKITQRFMDLNAKPVQAHVQPYQPTEEFEDNDDAF